MAQPAVLERRCTTTSGHCLKTKGKTHSPRAPTARPSGWIGAQGTPAVLAGRSVTFFRLTRNAGHRPQLLRAPMLGNIRPLARNKRRTDIQRSSSAGCAMPPDGWLGTPGKARSSSSAAAGCRPAFSEQKALPAVPRAPAARQHPTANSERHARPAAPQAPQREIIRRLNQNKRHTPQPPKRRHTTDG